VREDCGCAGGERVRGVEGVRWYGVSAAGKRRFYFVTFWRVVRYG